MFRPITKNLLRRQESLAAQTSVSVLVKNAVREYISERYPNAVTMVGVRYETEERLVIITTPSKALAGDLLFNTREIRAHLTAHKIPVSRIIAR